MKSMLGAGAVLAIFVLGAQTANAACAAITTANKLQAMKNDLAGDYCLKNDIDLSSRANFVPIGNTATPFTGKFDGAGFVIRNLKTDHSDLDQVGLFGLADNATIKNVTLENVQVVNRKNSATTGALVGTARNTTEISNVRIVSGQLASIATGNSVGGLAGWVLANATIERSSSAIDVGADSNSNTGGLVGSLVVNAAVRTSYATGLVFCGGTTCVGGGLVGAIGDASVTKSFATGTVVCSSYCGGFAGDASGRFSQIYAGGTVLGDNTATEGGLFGRLTNPVNTRVDQALSIGLVGGSGATVGGLIGVVTNSPTITNTYWNKDTSGLNTSAAGTGLTTTQLQKNMPAGFITTAWGITLKYSYPFLFSSAIDFTPQLATLVINGAVFNFTPISELDKSNYQGATAHIDQASLAACYTMIARTIGESLTVNALTDAAIDKYFWKDSNQKALWRGPVTDYATLGTFKTIGANTPLKNNVIAEMRKKNLVLLHGTYQKGHATAGAWVLGTLFSATDDGTLTGVSANDPFTGKQVAIDPVTKMVTTRGFPLKSFKVDGYRPVTIAFNN